LVLTVSNSSKCRENIIETDQLHQYFERNLDRVASNRNTNSHIGWGESGDPVQHTISMNVAIERSRENRTPQKRCIKIQRQVSIVL